MNESNEHRDLEERLTDAYHRMLERVKHTVEQTEKEAGPALHDALERAKQTATEIGELTRDEAERVGHFVRRDLQDAATFLTESGRELSDWLEFDFELVEQGLADLFAGAVDQTRAELERWSLQADAFGEWHSGEITGPGTLQCKSCGEVLRFHKPAHIPPCPKCHQTRFRRLTRE